ncbi:Fruit bromelain-like protein [Drosera capensis]
MYAFGIVSRNGAISGSSTSSTLISNSSMVKRHEERMVEYGRIYKDDFDKNRHFEIFKKNVELIDPHNQKNKGFALDVNPFIDLSDEEFQATYSGFSGLEELESLFNSTSFTYENITSAPQSINQVLVGHSAAAATVEGLLQINTGKLISLSEQQILDCDINVNQHSCSYGYVHETYHFIKQNGITTEKNYPYVGHPARKMFQIAAKIGGYRFR